MDEAASAERIRHLEERIQTLEYRLEQKKPQSPKNLQVCPNCVTGVFRNLGLCIRYTFYCKCATIEDDIPEQVTVTKDENANKATVTKDENANKATAAESSRLEAVTNGHGPDLATAPIKKEEDKETAKKKKKKKHLEKFGSDKVADENAKKAIASENIRLEAVTNGPESEDLDTTPEINSKPKDNKGKQEKQKGPNSSLPLEGNDDTATASNRPEEKSKQNQNRPEQSFLTFVKRGGTTDSGKEYEYMMCALYGIKLATEDTISGFEMTSNEKKYGDFDDISLKITFKDGTTKKFLLQLKHKDNANITTTHFSSAKGFSLIKYLESFEKMDAGGATLILYTNSPTEMTDNHEFDIQPKGKDNQVLKEFKNYRLQVVVKKYEDAGLDLLNTCRNKNEKSIFQFGLTETRTKFKKIGHFSQQFYFMANQTNVTSLRYLVRQSLESLLHQDVYDSFVTFINSWYLGNYVLNKHDVIAKLTELALSPWVKTLTNRKTNSKTDLVVETIMKFDATVVRNCDDIVADIWPPVPVTTPNLANAGKKYTVFGEENKAVWYLGLVPLVVKVDYDNMKQVICALQLLGGSVNDKKIVLVGDIDKEKFGNLRTFDNLSDLVNHEVYDTILSNFRVSLQGRGSISLHQLLCSDDLKKSIGVGDLLTMSHQDAMSIGDKEEKNLTEFYIPRSVTFCLLDTIQVIEFCGHSKNCILIINCDEKFQSDFQPGDVNVADISVFLEHEIHIMTKNLILLCVNNKCTLVQFQKIAKSFDKFNIYAIDIFDNDFSTLQFSKGDRLPLINEGTVSRSSGISRKKITLKQKSVPEGDIFENFRSILNVFCAPPGMGKSTLLQILSSTYCPADFCSIHVNLINHNSFLRSKPSDETILHHFLNLDGTLVAKVKTAFSQNGRMHLFLDGLDEVESEVVDVVLDFAKAVSSNNIHVWISSRENLEERISEKLNISPIEIEELSDQQRARYIHDRLAKEYNKNKITNIIDMVFGSADVTGSQQLLGVPLQLFIITELFLTKREAYDQLIRKNVFILTTMYRLFFEGKKKFHYQRIGVHQQEHQLGFNFNQHLKQYQIPALKSCLDSDDFSNLGLDLNQSQDFILDIKRDGDKYGIIKTINNDDQIIFIHQTYAEYFACVWFESHLSEVIRLKEVLFSARYQNLKLIFDIMMAEENPLHLAVVYKSLAQFDKHISDLKKKDKAGRSVLHLACSAGAKYPKVNHSKLIMHLGREQPNYIKIVDALLSRFHSVFDRDTLFNYHCIDYSLKSYCLYPIEKMLETRKINFDFFSDIIYGNFGAKNLAYYSAQLGYPCIFAAVIVKYSSFINDQSFGEYGLLGTAIVGSRNDQYIAPREGNIKIVDMLINKGADVNVINKEGLENDSTLLDYVCDNGIYDMVQILMDHGAECTEGNNILHRTALKGTLNHHIINVFSRSLKFLINAGNANMETPLHLASKVNDPEIVKLLLDNGANINTVAKNNNTALHFAAEANCYNVATIRLLCGSGVRINAQNVDGRTALHIAAGLGQVDNVEELLSQNVDITIVDREGSNALHRAAFAIRPNPEILQILKDCGFDINARNRLGKTPLHLACTLSQLENVQKLIELGSDLDIVDAYGKNALHFAAQSGYDNVKTIKLLISRGVGVNAQMKDGQTPLHLASRKGVLKNVEELIRNGADVNLVDCDNKNPYYYAYGHGNEKIIWLIWNEMEKRKNK